jgi:hypothetical protein
MTHDPSTTSKEDTRLTTASTALAYRPYNPRGRTAVAFLFRPVGVMRQYARGADGVFHEGLLMDRIAPDLEPQLPQEMHRRNEGL